MTTFDLPSEIVDSAAYKGAVDRLQDAGVLLPKFSELAKPDTVSALALDRLRSIDPDSKNPANLFRVHWYNDANRREQTDVPGYVELPRELTGVNARIVVLLGERFPLIQAHKVLAAYACLVPRIITGSFDPSSQRAIWPSTGNYCRGGIAISRIMGCRGVAVLPEGMSAERFEWLRQWVIDPADIIRTPGSESNVKEIYDECAELANDAANVIVNQFSEFGNYLVHWLCTGTAMERVFEEISEAHPGLRLAAFVAGSGSAGTLGAGDYLKESRGARIVVVEPVECPTLLYNGYGEHNIQGIGDKHVPLIHNVMNGDLVVGVSDRGSDGLNLLFNSDVGRAYLTSRRGLAPALVESLSSLGLSGIANVLGAIKTARRLELDASDVILTVATDSAGLYVSERDKWSKSHYSEKFDEVSAAELYGEHLLSPDGDHVLELTHRDRRRIFDLGYYTWVEQQGVSLEAFEERRRPEFWRGLQELVPVWDELIERFNFETGLSRRTGLRSAV